MYSSHTEECLDLASVRVLAGRPVVAPENSPCKAGKKYLWRGSPDEKEASGFSGRGGQPVSGEGSNSSSLPCFCDGARPLITPINLHTKWPCSCRKQPRCRRGEANWGSQRQRIKNPTRQQQKKTFAIALHDSSEHMNCRRILCQQFNDKHVKNCFPNEFRISLNLQ